MHTLVSGAIRNTGAGWGVIADAGHSPEGITGVVTETDHIRVEHAVGGIAVGSLQVTVDETYAARGVRVGASVGVDYSRIYLYDQPADRISDYVTWDGTQWVSEADAFTAVSFAGAILTLAHEDMGPGGAVALGNRGSMLAQAGACTPTTTQLAFYTGAYGALVPATAPAVGMRVYVTRYGHRAAPPADPAAFTEPGGNLWLTGLIITPEEA